MNVNEHTANTSSAINNGTLTVAGNLKVGSWGNGTLTLGDNSTTGVNGDFTVGEWNKNDKAGKVTVGSNAKLTVGGNVAVGANRSEEGGTGSIEITGSNSSIEITKDLNIGGMEYAGTGSVSVTGASSNISVGSGLYVGRSSGTGTLLINSANSTTTVTGNMSIAIGETSTGDVTIAGDKANLSVGGTLTVGEWGQGTLTVDTGASMSVTGLTTIGYWGTGSTSGTLTNNGSITVYDDVQLGFADKSAGKLILNSGSTFTVENSKSIYLSNPDTGHNTSGSGTITVDGGTLSAENSTLYLNNAKLSTTSASLEIKNNGSVTLNKIIVGNSDSVEGSTATLTLDGGTLSVVEVQVSSSNVANTFNLGDGTVIAGSTASSTSSNGSWWQAININLKSEEGTKIQVDSDRKAIFNSTMTGDGGIEKTGDGTLRLSYRAKEYTGKTTVSAGTLDLMYENVLANSSEVINNAAITFSEDTYKGTTPNQTLNNLSGTGTIDANNYELTLYNDKATTYSGTISNVSSLSMKGDGVITLTKNVQTNTVKVDAGTLRFSDGTSSHNEVTYTSKLTVGEAGQLDFNFYEFNEGTEEEGKEFDQLTLDGELALNGDDTISVTFKSPEEELKWHTNLLDSLAGDANGYKLISMENTAYLGDLNKYLDNTGLSKNWALTGTEAGIFLTAVAPQPGSGVPEPSTWALLLLGLVGLLKITRKK